MRLDHGLRVAGRAGRVQDRHGVLGRVREALRVGECGGRRRGELIAGLDPAHVMQRARVLRPQLPKPLVVAVDPDRRRAPAEQVRRRGGRPAVDQHADRADRRQREVVDRVRERVLHVDGHAVARLDALVEVPDRPALGEAVEIEQAELVQQVTIGVRQRPHQVDERQLGAGVGGDGGGEQVAGAPALVGGNGGTLLHRQHRGVKGRRHARCLPVVGSRALGVPEAIASALTDELRSLVPATRELLRSRPLAARR